MEQDLAVIAGATIIMTRASALNRTPQLDGPQVSLVPLSLEQVEALCRHSADPSLWTWWIREPPIEATVMRREVEAALASRDAGSRIPFAIYHRGRSEHIGSTSLWNYDAKHRSIEIGEVDPVRWTADRLN